MEIKVKLNANTQGEMSLHEPIILPEDKLELNIQSDMYIINSLVVTARNGAKEIKKKLNKELVLDLTELLFPGRIEVEMSMLCKGDIVKNWRLNDLVIKDVKHRFELTPEIAELRGAIAEITKILKNNNLF